MTTTDRASLATAQLRADALNLADKLESLTRSAVEALRLGDHVTALGYLECLPQTRAGLTVYCSDLVRKSA